MIPEEDVRALWFVNGRPARFMCGNDGQVSYTFEFTDNRKRCSKCHKRDTVTIIRGCPNWESGVRRAGKIEGWLIEPDMRLNELLSPLRQK